MTKIFLLISGENPTLPVSEAKSILQAERHSYQILEELPQVLRIEASLECVVSIESRTSMTRICALEVFNCEAEANEILRNTQTVDLSPLIKEGESFVVRVRRTRGSAIDLGRWKLEQKIGGMIFRKVKDVRVNLRNPQKTFIGILTNNRFVFGLRVAEIKPKTFVERGPRRRAFFHPTAMPAKLARCMVNLAQPKKGELVLDPFCGTGSFLVEASLIGCRVLGFDADLRMVRGSIRNLSYYGVEPQGIALADARSIPLADSTIDSVVTDPPYGISATTFGVGTAELIEGFLSNIIEKIKKGRCICIAAPKNTRIGELGERLGFEHLESHFVYVHRRLTREIAVLRRG